MLFIVHRATVHLFFAKSGEWLPLKSSTGGIYYYKNGVFTIAVNFNKKYFLTSNLSVITLSSDCFGIIKIENIPAVSCGEDIDS